VKLLNVWVNRDIARPFVGVLVVGSFCVCAHGRHLG
jgi:hypothetical protein